MIKHYQIFINILKVNIHMHTSSKYLFGKSIRASGTIKSFEGKSESGVSVNRMISRMIR